jgi:hypothetical protein
LLLAASKTVASTARKQAIESVAAAQLVRLKQNLFVLELESLTRSEPKLH